MPQQLEPDSNNPLTPTDDSRTYPVPAGGNSLVRTLNMAIDDYNVVAAAYLGPEFSPVLHGDSVLECLNNIVHVLVLRSIDDIDPPERATTLDSAIETLVRVAIGLPPRAENIPDTLPPGTVDPSNPR